MKTLSPTHKTSAQTFTVEKVEYVASDVRQGTTILIESSSESRVKLMSSFAQYASNFAHEHDRFRAIHGDKQLITHVLFTLRDNSDRVYKVEMRGFVYNGRPSVSVSSYTALESEITRLLFNGDDVPTCSVENCVCGNREADHAVLNRVKRAQLRELKAIITTVLPDVEDVKFSRKAGCSCGCSPAFLTPDMWSRTHISLTVTEAGYETKMGA